MSRIECLSQRRHPCSHGKVARKETRSGHSYAVCACDGCNVILVARWAAAFLAPPGRPAADHPVYPPEVQS